MPSVETSRSDSILTVTINRPEARNAVDAATAAALADAFRSFDADETLYVAVLTGAGGSFCAGADLKAIAAGRPNALSEGGDGPMGPTRMLLSKPAIAAIEGHAVAGGLEVALWCGVRGPARPTARAASNAGDPSHRRPRRGRRLGAGAVVRPARGGARPHAGGFLPALWRAVDRSGDHPAAAADRAEPGTGPDPDRARGLGGRSVAHGTGQSAGGIRSEE